MADVLFHSFMLLKPTFPLLIRAEVPYRAHCREILERMARGEDTRPGTAAEICCVVSEASLRAPMIPAASGLYMRMWDKAGLPEIEGFKDMGEAHEKLDGTSIDALEREVRRNDSLIPRLPQIDLIDPNDQRPG
jgi:hypothetical protein